ncbi:proton-conducting transporter membrane subunit [uncultured Gimesia sp.]|jgi:hypothetical protein|uniref:proton-conducting transporter transmembrane domain-containing protein n=1 Tax=uncultured Gimesia sp. TaxID=1678688 RepID=UPI00262F0D5B|nr:proton-conducting transporter membrane subunit [uncultured Gimesia sp.]
MFNDLFFLVFAFELILYLLLWLIVCRIQFAHKKNAVLLFQSVLPLTAILFTGVVLLSASVGSTHLESIRNYLSRIHEESVPLLNHSIPALGIILIVTGIAFHMGAIPVNFRIRVLLKEIPYWLSILSVLISACAGAVFLILFVHKIAVISYGYTEQILFFMALIVLASTAGLLLIESELKITLILIVMQITGVFFAQLSATCWKWRHEPFGGASISIPEMMKAFAPELIIFVLAVFGLACLLDSLGNHQTEIKYQEQLQGLIGDQRLLGSVAVVLLATLMGFPGLALFRMKWQTLQTLFEIQQESSAGMMATVHAGYLGLAVVMVISSTIVAFVCAKLIIQICFAKPLTRYRQIAQKRMAFICFCCLIGSMILNLRMIVNL